MIVNANDLSPGTKLIAQVAIIGSGIAGALVALKLEDLGIDVLLIEAGDIEKSGFWKISTSKFHAADYGVAESYVDLHIQKKFGGGSNVWGGWCSCLREVNFLRQDLHGYPTWPIEKSDLKKYYEEACSLLQVPNFDEIYADGFVLEGVSTAQVKKFGFSPPVRVPSHFADRIRSSKSIKLVYNIEVKKIRSNNRKTASVLDAVTQKGERCSIMMKHVVLAGGAVANSRLIDESFKYFDIPNDVRMFNGNYLTEHPHVYNRAKIILKNNIDKLFKTNDKYKSGSMISIAPGADWIRKNNIPDFNFQIAPIPIEQLTAKDKILIKNSRAIYGEMPTVYSVTLCVEHLPSKLNKVLGSKGQDGDIHLTFGDPVKRTMDAAIEWFKVNFAHYWIEEDHSTNIVAVGHLHGTTRMAESPEQGVVDKNLVVFGTDNLFVVGSSVFPSAGFVNPTLTIGALSCRLSEHFRRIS
jgi:hypothetical protein